MNTQHDPRLMKLLKDRYSPKVDLEFQITHYGRHATVFAHVWKGDDVKCLELMSDLSSVVDALAQVRIENFKETMTFALGYQPEFRVLETEDFR
jgi:hypothetical protein